MKVVVAIDGSEHELLAALHALLGQSFTAEIVQGLRVGDPARYRFTGRISDHGDREAIDVRTGRRGATDQYGIRFTPGLIINDDGGVDWEHPSDNPWQGCRWS